MLDTDVVKSFKAGIGKGIHSVYSEVHVLLISWAEHDLEGVDEEIDDLRDVFEKEYNYSSVSLFSIPVDGSQGRRLNNEISSFVQNQSESSDSLIIIYYAGHCGPDDDGKAQWAAFEKGGPTLSWSVPQQLLFMSQGDVLLILDCCNASIITKGSKDGGGRFELIAASAKGVDTPGPGRKSFTRALVKILKKSADEGISTEGLTSSLREDAKVTETPVFHDFVRQSRTEIRLQRLPIKSTLENFIQKPSSHVMIRASLSDDPDGMQIARWLKTAPPSNVTAVEIEAIVCRARRIQAVLEDGAFPAGSIFWRGLSKSARNEMSSCFRNLNAVLTTTKGYAEHNNANASETEELKITKSLGEIQDAVSTICAAVETPLLLDNSNGNGMASTNETTNDTGFSGLMAATEADAALLLRQALLQDGSQQYSFEVDCGDINFTRFTKQRKSERGPPQRRFKLGTVSGDHVIIETYNYKEALDHTGEPQSQTLQQVRKVTNLLCHPKRKAFHILPCVGFFRNRLRQELGLVFKVPPTYSHGDGAGVTTLLRLYEEHKYVPLEHRIRLAWVLTTALEHFHRVGWVHKSIRSDNIAFTTGANGSQILDPSQFGSQEQCGNSDMNSALVGDFDIGNPLLFGFEYSRADDEATYFEEDHSYNKNLYRHPDRWGRPAARFEKFHDMYSLGVVLLEIALWKEVRSIVSKIPNNARTVSNEISESLIQKCKKHLPHQVGTVFTECILTCLEFRTRTHNMTEYEMQLYFQRTVIGPISRVVGKR